jgi:CubicO group peptidase (beta-lactamase class C family)
MPGFPRVRQVVERFLAERVSPCAVVEVGTAGGPSWSLALGALTYESGAQAATVETVFDLASLTKVLATASVAMRLVETGRLDLGAPVMDLVPGWRGPARARVTVTDLLAHRAGLPAHRPYFERRAGRAAFEEAICAEPLEYQPGTASVYSDLGFILLGFILEDAGAASLDAQANEAVGALCGAATVRFGVRREWRERVAPTSNALERRGIVDDGNAWALGGVAGHAGLFGTAAGVGAIARAVLSARTGDAGTRSVASPALVLRFTSRASPASSRGLAWDTMLPTSSCGTRMSAQAFGHTGFTGTSLWIDPEAGLYVVLLTNRVYPVPGPSDGIQAFRRSVHEAAVEDWAPHARRA